MRRGYCIGDLQKGLGNNKYNWYRWSACSLCGKERWVVLIKGQLRNKTCVSCIDRSKATKAMHIANLGVTRSQATRDRISQARRQKVWEYAKVPPENPSIGDKAMVNRKSCIRFACSMCGKERWVRTNRGGVPSCIVCKTCITDETRNKLRLKELGQKHSPERVEANRLAQIGKVISEETRRKISITSKGRQHSQIAKEKLSQAHKHLWANPIFREDTIKRLCEARWTSESREKQALRMINMLREKKMSPNKIETRLLKLLNKYYPNEWAFVGDFSLIIGGKSPDFANVNGKKLLVELWGEYWHRNDNSEERIALFSKFGYHTLVVWERELKNEEILIPKIQEFVG